MAGRRRQAVPGLRPRVAAHRGARGGATGGGRSGRDALRFLLQDPTEEGRLGSFIQQRQQEGDGRLAIVDVCSVPMQEAAFRDGPKPDLDHDAWDLIRRVRTSSTSIARMRSGEPKDIAELLVQRLRRRVEASLGARGAHVVAAGVVARRMVEALPSDLDGGVLRAPHPSYDQWNRISNQTSSDLLEVQGRFMEAVT